MVESTGLGTVLLQIGRLMSAQALPNHAQAYARFNTFASKTRYLGDIPGMDWEANEVTLVS